MVNKNGNTDLIVSDSPVKGSFFCLFVHLSSVCRFMKCCVAVLHALIGERAPLSLVCAKSSNNVARHRSASAYHTRRVSSV